MVVRKIRDARDARAGLEAVSQSGLSRGAWAKANGVDGRSLYSWMRGSVRSMVGAARRLGLEPLDGHCYLFFDRRRRLCKMVWFDGSGWCLLSQRLERGTFELPPTDQQTDLVRDQEMGF